MKKQIIISAILSVLYLPVTAASLEINGGRSYKYSPNELSTGLNMGVYVVSPIDNLTITFTSDSYESMQMYTFTSSGTSAKLPASGAQQTGNKITLSGGARDCGYVIEQGGSSYCFWVSTYIPVSYIENDYSYTNICMSARITGEGITIPYYTTTGSMDAVPRTVRYYTWEWDEENQIALSDVLVEEDVVPELDDKIVVTSPYQKTLFTIVDKIPESWGSVETAISTAEEFEPRAIFLHSTVTQSDRRADNELEVSLESGVLGGSAPVTVNFKAYVNEDNYVAWQIFHSEAGADDPDPVIEAIYPVDELSYTFKDAGTVYVRLYSENNTCSEYETYTVTISESYIDAPNAFSPGASPGVNDEWRVAYKSIVEFKCVIFDRWGQEVCRFEDPAMGWDGYYHGKLAPPGVYFYVIQARGSDGNEYKLKGHINIIRGRN
ncbi:MAG: gliding motility-associated C-terminal domain-containing protein [Bacteroidetes bacterium]|uniref:Gliding motility-associated C-terminal domain-containing protein n=1 Tax=Candidatus Caccoplasma merdipullorum TaxID=2840718 RepID=A0A9D9E2G1_9BACT|nr:gliding motility-associated C-terminal domain-containing protein [Candidatus Caccoplasma merdipullorum]